MLAKESLKVYLESFFDAMRNAFNDKISCIMEGQTEIRKEMSEMKEELRSVKLSVETLKTYGMTNLSALKKIKYEDALENFNICFTETMRREVMKVVIINYISKRPCSLMEERDVENKVVREHFSSVMSALLFGKMRTQSKTVWKSGVGLEASVLKRKLMYSTLVNVQKNRFDQFRDEDEVERMTESSREIRKIGNEERAEKLAKEGSTDGCSAESNSNRGKMEKVVRPEWLMKISERHIDEARNQKETRKMDRK